MTNPVGSPTLRRWLAPVLIAAVAVVAGGCGPGASQANAERLHRAFVGAGTCTLSKSNESFKYTYTDGKKADGQYHLWSCSMAAVQIDWYGEKAPRDLMFIPERKTRGTWGYWGVEGRSVAEGPIIKRADGRLVAVVETNTWGRGPTEVLLD